MLLKTLLIPLPAALLAASAPALTVDRTHHAFGELHPIQAVRTTFQVGNSGDGVLEIRSVHASCGCTTGRVDRPYLRPGETTTVELVFDPRTQKGRSEGVLVLTTNDPKRPRVELSFEAEVVQPVAASEEAIFFPDTLPHDRTTREVRVHATVDRDLKLTLHSTPPPFLAVAITEGKREALLRVTLDGSRLPREGGVQGRLVFATGVPERPEIALEYYGFAGHAIQAQPEGLAFDPEGTGKPQSFIVKLSEIRNRPFRVKGIRTVPPPFQARLLSSGSAPQHELAVSLGASVPRGSYEGRVILEVEDPDQGEVEIPVAAQLK